jgi:hypothetical protein
MFGSIDATLEELYPSGIWGEPDDAARFESGVSTDEAAELAEDLAATLDAATIHRVGDDDEYCDYIYILCVGREPCLVQIRDGGVAPPDELGAGDTISEQYLRVCLSSLARFAGVQQVAVDGMVGDGAIEIVERPRAGVYDAPLLRRFQTLVASLPARDILHLDFGEISAPHPTLRAGAYPSLFGGEPAVANYLFYPQPVNTVVTELISRRST